MGKMRNAYKIYSENLIGRDHLQTLEKMRENVRIDPKIYNLAWTVFS
jgi:hypothetical protein